MLPEKFKDMFGIKDQKDMKMANNIWKMLDDMSSNDPQAYQKFIQKNLTQGLTDAKVQKQKKQKPYKIIPHEYMLLQMDAQLEQQYIGSTETTDEKQQKLKQKLDMNINKQKWSDVRNKFQNRIRILLNICHTDRVKNPTSRSKGGQQIKQFNISMMKDIQNLYYSLQGPHFQKNKSQKQQGKQKENIWYFCMIFSTSFIRAFEAVPNGRRIFLGICAAYFQERIKADRNPILLKVNTHSLYGKNLYYGIDKLTIEVNQNKKFKYGEHQKPCQYLLQKQVDTKQRHQIEKEKPSKKTQAKKPPQILTKPPPSQKSSQQSQLALLQPQKPQKKILIQVLDEKDNDDKKQQDNKIPYEMKQTEEGYYFEFLVPGVQKIQQLDLEVSKNVVKLKCLANKDEKEGRSVQIKLKKSIDQDRVKAKMKKKVHVLQVTVYYLN